MFNIIIVYDHDLKKVVEFPWSLHTVRSPTPPKIGQCECCCGEIVRTAHGERVTYRCSLSAAEIINGVKYCWRHRRMLVQGKNPQVFPPKEEK